MMLYFSIQNARGEREKKPRLRGGLRTDGFMLGSCSDHSGMMLGTVSDRSRSVNDVSPVLVKNFCHMLGGHFSWQAQYLVRLDNDTCCFSQCK